MASPVRKRKMDSDESEDDSVSSEQNESAEDTWKEKKKEKIRRPRITHVGNGEIKLSWDAIEGCHRYVIRCRLYLLPREWDIFTPDTAYTISGVDPGSSYELSIEANGKVSEAVRVEAGDVVPDPPINLKVSSFDFPNTSILVSFDDPNHGLQCQYRVIAKNIRTGEKIKFESDLNCISVENLEVGGRYSIAAQCINGGAESKSTVFDQVNTIFGGGHPSIIDSASEFSLRKNLDDEGDERSIVMLGEEARTKIESKIEIGYSRMIRSKTEKDTSGLRVSPIHKEVRKVLPNLHEGSMQKLLDTFYEIGIHEVSDLEYLLDEDVAKEAKDVLRIVEFKKLLKHARGIKESNSCSEVTEPEEITELPSELKPEMVKTDATITLTKVVAGLVADGQSHVDYTATGTNMQVSSM